MLDRDYGRLPLGDAVAEGNLDLVRKYVAEGADMETVYPYHAGRAALGLACSRGHTAIVRFLLDAGANPHGPTESTQGPLLDAVESGNIEIVQMLIDHGADMNAVEEHGWHALLFAASRCDIYPDKGWGTVVRLLIAAGSDVNHVDKRGQTALKHAIGYPGNESALEVIRILLEAGAEVDSRHDDSDWTPLMDAVEKGNIAAVRLLAAAGADVNLTDDLGDTAWNMALRWGYTDVADLLEHVGAVESAGVEADLRRAILWGKTEAVARLLEQGVDVNALDQYAQTPLRAAIEEWGKVAIVRLLLDHGANINTRDEAGTLLMAAVQNYRTKLDPLAIVSLLIERRADIHDFQHDCTMALYDTAHTTNTEIARLLLDAGADVNECNWQGRTPLMEAAHNGRHGMVELLLAYGANINARALTPPESEYYGGSTTLMAAVKSQHLELARLLLEHGADVNAADDAGYTSLMWDAGHAFGAEDSEAWKTSLALVRLLLEWNADVNRQNIHKQTALDLAVSGIWGIAEEDEGEWSEIALLLQQAGAVRGEPRPRWCYMAVPCEVLTDPSEDDETSDGAAT